MYVTICLIPKYVKCIKLNRYVNIQLEDVTEDLKNLRIKNTSYSRVLNY